MSEITDAKAKERIPPLNNAARLKQGAVISQSPLFVMLMLMLMLMLMIMIVLLIL
jgi:hypothetical protein